MANLSYTEINHGGAIFLSVLNNQIVPKFMNSKFIANKAKFGGAMHMLTTNQNEVAVLDCLFEGNEASSAGQFTNFFGSLLVHAIVNFLFLHSVM